MFKPPTLPALVLLLLLVLALPAQTASSRSNLASLTASDILAAVNALRASQGLEPYEVDSGLMAYAQAHSEYQAAIQTSTHEHKDGSVSLSIGVVENVAGGDSNYLTAEMVVYGTWADPVHMQTMVGHSSGAMGVGVAVNGGTMYITLNVRPGGQVEVQPTVPGAPASTRASENSAGSLSATQVPPTPFQTATPQANGSILHIVGPGQSLWSIAISYGVRIDDLRRLNGLAAESNTIYEGQKLLVYPPGQAPTGTANMSEAAAESAAPVQETPQAPLPAPTQTPGPEPEENSPPAGAGSDTGSPDDGEADAGSQETGEKEEAQADEPAALAPAAGPGEEPPAAASLPPQPSSLPLGQALPLLVILVCAAGAAAILRSGFRKKPGL